MPQGVLKGERVQPDFALFDHRLIVLEDILNRVLHGDNMLFALGVDVLDHRRQRGGLAAAGGAGQQHDPAGGLRDLF